MKTIVSICLLLAVEAHADAKVQELLNKVDRLYRSDTSVAEMNMQVVTEDWSRTLSMKIWTKGMDYTLVEILEPKKDKGIKTLKRKNQMWNFFPKIGRLMKVPPSMMMNSWMGSDFTNDDLVKENTLLDDFAAELSPHPKDPKRFYFVTLTPKEQTVTVWSKMSIAIDRSTLLPVEQVYYGEAGKKKRVMTLSEVRTIGGKRIPTVIEMRTVEKKRKTVMKYTSVEFDQPMDKNLFSVSRLRRK